MKRLLIIIMLFISIWAQGQSIIDHLGKIRMRYNNAGSNDTLLIQFSGDSTYYFSNTNRFHKFKSGIVADSLKLNGGGGWIKTLIPSQWTTSGSNIYYNTGNVGINNATPSYKLDVGGLIRANNLETNLTTKSTKLGLEAGKNEVQSGLQENTMIGAYAGTLLTTGYSNTLVGSYVGERITTGHSNTILGLTAGGYITTGNSNTLIGLKAGELITGNNNIMLGSTAGQKMNSFSNRFIVNSMATASIAEDSTKSIIYGVMSTTPANQRLTVNGLLTAHNLETNITSESTKLGYNALTNEDESASRGNTSVGAYSGTLITDAVINSMYGYYSGNKNTSGVLNTFIGGYSGSENTEGLFNNFLGAYSGASNINGNFNIFIGTNSSINNIYGSGNVIIGNESRYFGKNFSNELVIDNQKRGVSDDDSLLYRSRSLLYGEFAPDPLDQTLTFNAKTNLHAHSALFGRNAAYNITSTNTWLTLKMDTMCAPVTSSGFEFNADSTGVKVLFNGFVEVSGHAKLLNKAASQQTANIYVRLRLNGNEVTQFNTAVGRTFNANGAHDLVSVTGFIPVSVNDVISVQCRTDNANIDLEQTDGGVFDGSSSFCIFLKEMKFVKTFE